MYINTGQMNIIGVELAVFHDFFYLNNSYLARHCRIWVKVSSRTTEYQVTRTVCLISFYKRNIGNNGTLHDKVIAIELANLFAFSNHGTVTRTRIERGDTCTTSTQTLCQSTLGRKFE